MGLLPRIAPDPVPAEARDEVQRYSDEFNALRASESGRLRRMHDYRREMDAVRECDPAQDITGDYGRVPRSNVQRRHNITLPYGRALTVKHANRIAGPTRIPDARVERRDDSPEERYRSDTMEKVYWGCYRASDGQQQLSTAAWDGAEVGAGCFEAYFDIKAGMAKFRAIDPAGVVVVRGLDDPHDFQRLYRFWNVPLATLRSEYSGQYFGGVVVDVDEVRGDKETGLVTIVQAVTRNRKVRFALQGSRPVPLYEQTHDYGFVNYVVVPNLGPERQVWGFADYEFVRALCHYIPALFGREADILRFVSNGAFKSKGTKQSSQQIAQVLAQGGVLPVGKEGDVEPIQVPEVPAFEEAHAGRALTMLQDLGFSPPASWGAGGAGSGSDRGLQLAPAVELAQMKQVNWGSGLSRLGGMLFQMIEQKQVGATTYRGVARSGFQRKPFSLTLDSKAAPDTEVTGEGTPDEYEIVKPRNPKELFAGDYCIEFSWQNRNDPDDPAYVASELNKFAQGVQSLQTTLERLGVQAPEDELKLIEDEAQKHPWLRQGMMKLLELQFAQASGQGAGGGGDQRSSADLMTEALGTMTGGGGGTSGALDGDAATAALPGATKTLYGQA